MTAKANRSNQILRVKGGDQYQGHTCTMDKVYMRSRLTEGILLAHHHCCRLYYIMTDIIIPFLIDTCESIPCSIREEATDLGKKVNSLLENSYGDRSAYSDPLDGSNSTTFNSRRTIYELQ